MDHLHKPQQRSSSLQVQIHLNHVEKLMKKTQRSVFQCVPTPLNTEGEITLTSLAGFGWFF